MNLRVPRILPLNTCAVAAVLASCGTTTVSLDYQPTLGENLPGPRLIALGRFPDMRGENAYYFGEVRITSRQPVEELVRNSFSHGLNARGMLAGSGAPFVLSGEILDLRGDRLCRPASYARIRVKLLRTGSGQVVFNRVYTGERTSHGTIISESISRALQDVVDRALDDRSMRERIAPASMPADVYRSNVF
jgi:hypothetical protein